jgi:hypothetical protein
MSDLRETTLSIEVVGDRIFPMRTGIPVTAYADESGIVSKVTIDYENTLKLITYVMADLLRTISEQVARQAVQIQDLQKLLNK